MRRKEQRSMLMLAIIMAFVLGVFWAGPVGAGGGNPCAALQKVADRLGCELGKPDRNDAPVEKTGQTTSYHTGDDGNLTMGVAWPNPRFTDNEDGTVTDNLTGLIWLENANCFGAKPWASALDECNRLQDGECGLSDYSGPGDWRLPNVKELQSLIHYGVVDPALPDTSGTGKWKDGDPFIRVVSYYYWSSTTLAYYTQYAWRVCLYYGTVDCDFKASADYYVWPVRGGIE